MSPCGLRIADQIRLYLQISKRNTARLQYLAHLVADSLVSIAQHMQGRWDVIPSALKTMLDEFEVYVLG